MFQIKKMRERAGMTQQEVADALGVTLKRYGNWEREDREINLRDAINLANLLKCSLDELAGHKPNKTRKSPPLSTVELEIIDAYRDTDARGRENITETARREKRQTGQPEVDVRKAE